MLKKGIYVLFLVLAQIAFAQKEDLCIDQPHEESYSDGQDMHPYYNMYYNRMLKTVILRYWKRLHKHFARYDHDNLRMISINCTIHKSICICQNITHSPTFKFFKSEQSKGITFNGKLDIASTTAFIDEQLYNSNNG